MWQERAKDILSTLKVELSPEQAEVFFDGEPWPGEEARLRVLGAGEGAGKSFMGALIAVVRAVSQAYDTKFAPQLIWLVGVDFEDARKEAQYLIGPEHTWLEDLGILDRDHSSLSVHPSERLLIATTIGATFETVSGHDYTKIGRDQPSGIVGCEVGRWPVEVWNRCYGRLERKRGWGWFSGSFDTAQSPWMQEVWQQGQRPNALSIRSYTLPSWANRAIYPGGADDPAINRLRLQSSAERFLERYGGMPAPPQNSVLPQFRFTLHVSMLADYDPDLPVYLFADPGSHVYAVLFVQFAGEQVRVVDEVYMPAQAHQDVVQACMMKRAWAGVKASGKHVMDVAGTQVHSGAPTPVKAWYNATGLNFFTKKRTVDEEVERLRSALGVNPVTQSPYLLIHPRCKGLIAEMGGGASPVMGGGRWIMVGGKPAAKHDHACKALAYGLLAHIGTARPEEAEVEAKPVSYLSERPLHDGVSYLRRRNDFFERTTKH